MRLQRFEDPVGDRRERLSTKARRDQDYSRVLGIRRGGFVSKLDEVRAVRRNDRPPAGSPPARALAAIMPGEGCPVNPQGGPQRPGQDRDA